MKFIYLLSLFCLPLLGLSQVSSDSLCIKNKAFKIVILGSSTAAGSGPSTPDSAWVNRYRKALKAINPKNEVINLAQGGYSTFQLMPSDFIPPPTRPNPDTLRNITRAVALAPDAIVLNLPSNDTSTGVLPDEQLENFQTIWQTAQDVGIPIWICTTQPKNYTSPTLLEYQMQVRDSILLRYGAYSIDFWNPFATPEGLIDSLYDSGDGTHMNDAAHRILAQKVIDKNLLSAVFTIAPNPDFALLDFKIQPALCGKDAEQIYIEFINLGHPAVLGDISYIVNSGTLNSQFPMQSLESCVLDSFLINLSTADGGSFTIDAKFGQFHVDSDSTNDKLSNTFYRFPQPSVFAEPQLACLPTTFQMEAEIENANHITWYSDANLQNQISTDLFWESPFLTQSSTYYAQASQDTFHLQDSLFSPATINRDWNGMMFELVAKKKFKFNGLSVPINTLGAQNLLVYRKNGAIFGFENDSTAWTLTDTITIQVNTVREEVFINLKSETIDLNDTLSIYILLENPSGQMSYVALGDTVAVMDSLLQIQNGTGVSYRFRERYYPRNFIGKIHYEFEAVRPNACLSSILPVNLDIVNLSVDLGADSVQLQVDDVLLGPNSVFESYLWSTGETTPSILLSPSDWNTTWQLLTLEVTDENSCSAIDSVWVSTAFSSTNQAETQKKIQVFPNPTSSKLQIQNYKNTPFSYSIYNEMGQLIFSKTNAEKSIIDVAHLKKGAYWLEIKSKHQITRTSFLKI